MKKVNLKYIYCYRKKTGLCKSISSTGKSIPIK